MCSFPPPAGTRQGSLREEGNFIAWGGFCLATTLGYPRLVASTKPRLGFSKADKPVDFYP
jgi:hypothetical protein